ncbi:MAG: acyltransferase [Treponema sp.]|nr:acyltransferase [Treponema sp.]
MPRVFKKPIIKASPDISVGEPRISKLVMVLLRILGRLYLFLYYGIAFMMLHGDGKVIIDAFRRAMAGESRFIIAFRHPNGGEPQIISWYILFKLRAKAALNGVRFARSPHMVCVYSYEVVRWGGWAARFVMPNIGAMPIHHTKMDSPGMARIHKAIAEGPFPVAIAPEGQVSYTTDAVPRLEPGVIRIGFQVAERMQESGNTIPVEVLPVSVYFRFGSWGKATTEGLLKKTEKVVGLNTPGRKNLPFVERLRQCREHILSVNEERYKIDSDPSLSFEERLERVINAALDTAERMLGLKKDGDFFYRIYRLRQTCWDNIYLPGLKNFDDLTPIQQSVNNLRAGEAWYIGRHQELVDLSLYFRIPLPEENDSLHKKIEYVQNLWDFASRTMGGAYSNRVSIYPRKVLIQAAPPINLSDRLTQYKTNKKSAIADAMTDLENAFLYNISESKKA